MSDSRSLSPVEASEYDLIEAAMNESARGRLFLAEYARRNRSADTDVLLQAISRLEIAVASERSHDEVGQLRGDLMEMAETIARTKSEIAAISAPDQDQSRLGLASEALDAIVRTTERATSDILGAAEDVQEAAWVLRERGAEPAICDALDRHATQIYTACAFQDLTAQRTVRVVNTLRYLEERIAAMIALWGRRLDTVPSLPGGISCATIDSVDDLCQSDVDQYLANEAPAVRPPPRAPSLPLDDDLAFVPDASALTPVQAEPEAKPSGATGDDLAAAFADLDKLSIEEKIALFT